MRVFFTLTDMRSKSKAANKYDFSAGELFAHNPAEQ
jgi:hypothetical protein